MWRSAERSRELPRIRPGRIAFVAISALFSAALVGGVPPAGAAEPPTAEGWEFIRGPGALVPTDREYDSEAALRLDYHFENPYDADTVLAVRALPPAERDWTGYEAIRFAVDSDDTSGLRAAAVQIQLLSAGGAIVQSPLITLDTEGWQEINLPLYRLRNLIGHDFRWDEVLQERIVLRYQGGPFEGNSAFFGGWRRVPDTGSALPDVTTVPTQTITATLANGASIDFVVGADDNLLHGMAGARMGATELRTDDLEHLIQPIVRTAEGRTYRAFRFEGLEQDGETVTLRASAVNGDATLRWVFSPQSSNVRGQEFDGFAYRYELDSETERFERIEELATWEIGGSSEGNTAVLRGSSYASEVEGSLDSAFDTRDYWHTRVRFAHGDALEYQAGASGQLYLTYDRADLIETYFNKAAETQVFQYADVFVLNEESSVSTVDKWVLYAPEPITGDADLINAHTAVRDVEYDRLRQRFGITLSPILPQVTFYTEDSQSPLDEIIQEGWLEEAAELGFRVVNLGRLWDSDPDHGGPSRVAGVTLWNFDVAEQWGGNDALGRVIDAAHEEGLLTRMWSPTAQMSRNSPLVMANPEWQVVNRYGALGGNYWSLAGMDMFDPGARGLLHDGLNAHRDEHGLDGLWLDSFHDLGVHIFDHGNDPARPQVEETLSHVRDLREMGFNVYVEAYSPFGVSSNLFEPTRFAQFYDGHEYRAYEMASHFTADPMEIDFYRFAANKAMPYNSVVGEFDFWDALRSNAELRELVSQSNRDYNAVAAYMDIRRVLPEDRGVVWTQDPRRDKLALFAFDEFSFRVPGSKASVVDVTTGQPVPLADNRFTAEPRHTYLVSSRMAAELCARLRTPCG